jgi:MoaA/NifB/PqqE/SkfB family radical SAM enzyme
LYFTTVVKWNGDVVPCCTHRQGMQYVPGADARVFGNIFEKNIHEIWNSPDYQQARRLAADPMRSDVEPALRRSFCDACPALFDTTRYDNGQWANSVQFEDIFVLDGTGKPVRKAEQDL